MQSLSTNRQTIFKKINDRAKTEQIMCQLAEKKLPILKLNRIQHELKRKYTLFDGLKTNFQHYELSRRSPRKANKILNNIKMHMKTITTEPQKLKLLSSQFLSGMSQNLLPVPYHSQQYQQAVSKLSIILYGFINVRKQQVLIALGQISRNLYVFFENCQQQPYSLCCNSIVYIRLELKNAHTIYHTKNYKKSMQRTEQMDFVNTQFYCSKCRRKILQLFGQDKHNKTISPTQLKSGLKVELQRKKVNMSVLIGSGKFKSMRIDDTIDHQTALSKKFNPQSLYFQQKSKKSERKILKVKQKSFHKKMKSNQSFIQQFLTN